MATDFAPAPDRSYPWVRLGIAWVLTFAALPYLWGRTLVMALLVGYLRNRMVLQFAGLTALTIAIVFALTWKVRTPARTRGVFLGWLAANGVLIAVFAIPRMPLWLLVVIYLSSTLWVVWLAWLGAWPLRWPTRLGLLVVWLGLAAVAPALIRVEMLGDVSLAFNWRSGSRSGPATTDSPPPGPTAAGPIDLTPTPDDFPRYLGPLGTGVLPNAKIAGDWTQSPPREVWRRPVGEGWGAFAVVGGYAFTQEQQGERECVVCYRLRDGAEVWRHADETRFTGMGGVGPIATPTVAGGRVYAVGATGILNCLDGTTGKQLWSANILDGALNLIHGVAGSPLVDGDRVIVAPTGAGGPSLAAYHKDTGSKLWAHGTDRASYASPMIAELNGRRLILLNNSAGVTGHDAATGEVVGRAEWTNRESINAAQPIVAGQDRLFTSTGYGGGSALFRVNPQADGGWQPETVWSSHRMMKTKFTTPVLYQDHVYGLDEGILQCIEVSTGKSRWKDGRYGHGQVLLAGDRLIVQAESGAVMLVEATPERHIERGRVNALSSKTWNNLALAGKFLLVRNDREAVCYEVP